MAKNNNKKKGIVGPIILFVLILLVSTLFMSFSFSPKSRSKNEKHEYVMKEVFKDKNPRIVEIAMLGAHDAFTHKLSFTSPADSNDKNIVTSKVASIFAKGLAIRLSKSQNASATQLLYSGVRYLDVRVTKINGCGIYKL